MTKLVHLSQRTEEKKDLILTNNKIIKVLVFVICKNQLVLIFKIWWENSKPRIYRDLSLYLHNKYSTRVGLPS